MILVTGAAGKTGRALIRRLADRGAAVRALVRTDVQAQAVRAVGAGEVHVGDMRDPAIVGHAAAGVRAVYHICPNVSPDEIVMGRALVKAARGARVEQVAYHSVLHPQTERMPHHWHKLRVEEALLEAGLPVTILQPTAYMQNILAGWSAITERGTYEVPYPAETRLSLVDLEDVAAAAARVLTEPGHTWATYELVGTLPLSQTEVAEALGAAVGREVVMRPMPVEDWERQARQRGMGAHQVETLARMFLYYARSGLPGSPRVLRWLLDREPTSLPSFLERAARERPQP